jgi:hypothetical protein
MPVALAPEERQRIADEIERLLALLDAADGDPDMVPSLGSLDRTEACYHRGGANQLFWSAGSSDDREDEHDGSEPDVDDERDADLEPSLGALGSGYDCERFDQRRWAEGSRTELEQEHDGREPDVDDEPSLASLHGGQRPEFFDQCAWARGVSDEREEACEDEGADLDALGLAL